MPILKILTNLPRASVPADFIKEASEVFQKVMGTPMQVIELQVRDYSDNISLATFIIAIT